MLNQDDISKLWRKYADDGDELTEVIQFRVSKCDKAIFAAAARHECLTLSDWIRRSLAIASGSNSDAHRGIAEFFVDLDGLLDSYGYTLLPK